MKPVVLKNRELYQLIVFWENEAIIAALYFPNTTKAAQIRLAEL